jgi:hypothetical protein
MIILIDPTERRDVVIFLDNKRAVAIGADLRRGEALKTQFHVSLLLPLLLLGGTHANLPFSTCLK